MSPVDCRVGARHHVAVVDVAHLQQAEFRAARPETRFVVDARVLEPDPRHRVPRRDRSRHLDGDETLLMRLDRPPNLFPIGAHPARAVRVVERSVEFLVPYQRCGVAQKDDGDSPQRRAHAEARVAPHHECYDSIARHERSLKSQLVLGRCRHQGWEPRGECSEGREGSSALDSHGEGVI